MAGKPDDNAAPTTPDKDDKHGGDTEAGRLGLDDRGNVTWEWNNDGDLLADDTLGAAERVRALVDPRLDVVEQNEATDNPLSANTQRLKTGYNPYNSGALGKQTWKKKKDLHELSKWIELRKRIAERKDDE
jgi:hypothetical protein